jgi:hypothetical protein
MRAVDSNRTRPFEIIQLADRLFRSLAALISTKQSIKNSKSTGFARSSTTEPAVRSERSTRTIVGAAFGFFALLFVVASVLAVVALGQIQSLKSDLAILRRELLPLKERLARFEQTEGQKRDLEQQEEAQKRSDAEKKRADGELRNEPASLILTREESQLIRDYIKPALTPGNAAAPEIAVGDPVGGATIPLPSALTEKIPKLQGAKFTTRNGSIIIIRSNSRQADAVLNPN